VALAPRSRPCHHYYRHTQRGTLLAVDVLLEGVQAEADNIMLIGRIEELEAKLTKAVSALGGMVGLFSGYSLLLKGTHLKIVLYNARAALAELKRARR